MIVSAVSFLVGLALAWLWLRSGRATSGWECAGCGYPAHVRATGACPECGRALFGGISIRQGRTPRKRLFVVLAAGSSLFSIVLFTTGWVLSSGSSSLRWMPTAFLLVAHSSTTNRWVIDELNRRVGTDTWKSVWTDTVAEVSAERGAPDDGALLLSMLQIDVLSQIGKAKMTEQLLEKQRSEELWARDPRAPVLDALVADPSCSAAHVQAYIQQAIAFDVLAHGVPDNCAPGERIPLGIAATVKVSPARWRQVKVTASCDDPTFRDGLSHYGHADVLNMQTGLSLVVIGTVEVRSQPASSEVLLSVEWSSGQPGESASVTQHRRDLQLFGGTCSSTSTGLAGIARECVYVKPKDEVRSWLNPAFESLGFLSITRRIAELDASGNIVLVDRIWNEAQEGPLSQPVFVWDMFEQDDAGVVRRGQRVQGTMFGGLSLPATGVRRLQREYWANGLAAVHQSRASTCAIGTVRAWVELIGCLGENQELGNYSTRPRIPLGWTTCSVGAPETVLRTSDGTLPLPK